MRKIEPAVTDMTQGSAPPLQGVGAVEIVAAHHIATPGKPRWNGIAVGLVLCRAFGKSRNLLVNSPPAVPLAMAVRGGFLKGTLADVRSTKMNAHTVVG